MSNAALFASGALITLVFTIGAGLLVWGAILDGRYNREVQDRMKSAAADARNPTIVDTPVPAGRP